MPFDTTTLSLEDKLTAMGITPVPMAILEKLKKAQLRRYRASFMARPWPYLALGATFPAAMTYLCLTTTNHLQIGDYIVVGAISLLGGSFFAFLCRLLVETICMEYNIRLYGKPRWVESDRFVGFGAPERIKSVIRLFEGFNSNPVTLIRGDLIREHVNLDPYIVVQMGKERACLGIWDGDQVIACARVD